ncbi:ABC-F family ATP-binding cassette domain-containing protein [Flexivirga sp. ID2601S]|uniref:ABC-F family ATP-binding cassette domain-containing protein n=1 Tax=Flexivirga aerilata TaxID=1656889 RepID=A0A849AMY0_9MICO|nr:ABC-F family ATP-binding cassette domain-containing protein [Flexivirga aerilata]NNG38162.1 ABC-F family ATP-binding cassette domain-containing protein [Flexivirga aerilata]
MAITCTDLTFSYADRRVLSGVDLVVPPGARVGLVGENGSGKSTLLRLLAGADLPESGRVQVPADTGYYAQDSGLDLAADVATVLRDALAPLHDAVTRLEELAARLNDDESAASDYAALLEWATLHDAWDADRRAEVAAHRLGLAAIPGDRRVAQLSGGERSRLALAALLTRRPEAFLLDEPTNHLDDDGLDFLQAELAEQAGAVLVASHDRVFLDAVCTGIVDLDPSHFGTDGRGGRAFTGNYSDYLQAKRTSRRRWEEEFAAQQDELTELRVAARTGERDIAHDRPPRDNDKFIYGFKGQRVQATVSRRRRNAEQRIAALERERIPKPPAAMRFSGAFERQPIASVQLRDVRVPGRLRCERLDVTPGEQLLVTGANGSGKSTLLGVIAGRLSPAEGAVEVRAREIGLLAQEVGIEDPTRSPAQLYDAARPRTPLSSLGLLHPRDHGRPVGELSLGQQRRVELALLLARQPDLLLLDEPTNHLSLALVDELEEALLASPVTVVVASHDRWIRRRWKGVQLALDPPASTRSAPRAEGQTRRA